MAERIGNEDFERKVLLNGKLSVIEFYHDGCIACRMISPVLAEIEEKYADQIYVAKVNTIYEEKLTAQFGIKASPTLLFFKEGKQVLRLIGIQKEKELEKMIEENL